MLKNPFSAPGLLNLVLIFVLMVGGFASYRFGNFGGVSFDELGEKYIPKEDVKFSDLPTSLQERYIDKEATIGQSKEGNLLEDEFFDETGKPIPESEVTPRDLKRMIQKLQKTLLFLQHDNLLINNEKNELAKKLEEQHNEREEEKNQLLNKNLEKINEAEQQHYRNISDLTMKLNELQKENVLIAQKANIEVNTLKSTIEELKTKMIEDENKKYEEIQRARADEQSKLVDYKDKIKLLNDQIALLNEQINTNNETAKSAFARKQEEITKLKEDIALGIKEKNELMAKQTQTLVNIDQKHQMEIVKYNQSIEQLKSDTEKLIAKNRQEMASQEEDNLKKVAIQEEKVKALTMELASSKKHIDALMLENEKDFNKFRTYLEDEKKLNKELSAATKKAEENAAILEKSLNATILKQNEEVVKKEAQIKELENKIIALQNDKINVEAEIKKRVDENDRIHNKNYKVFNEKIATFELAKQEMLAKLDKQLNEYKAASEENHKKMQYHTTELTRANSELKNKYEAKEKELNEHKNLLTTLKIEQQKVTESAEAKLKEIKSAFDELRVEAKAKEGEYLSKLQNLEAQMRAKDIALAAAKREESLKISALEKEIKNKEVDLLASRDEVVRKEEALKSLHVKMKSADENATKSTNKQILELKDKLALMEKNRLSEEAKVIALKEEQKRKELEYLDQLKEAQNALKAKDATLAQGKESLEKKLLSSEQTIKTLTEKIKLLETATPKAAPVVAKAPAPKGKKLELIDSISCTDMGTGVNAISATCKNNVQAFLAKYDSSYFYEVAPIVDNGGFASLKLIKSKKVGVEDSEIDRITGLANIGLGKARAKAGGELVESYVGEGAKISYALSNVEQDKARGFLIKVYQ